MSILVCGEISFGTARSDAWLDDYARQLVQSACRDKMHVMLGCNISQPIVFDMLCRKDSPLDGRNLPFLLSGSPLDNTSESVIEAYVLDKIQSIAQTRQNLERIERFLHESWCAEVQDLTLIMADASADSFIDATTTISGFVETAISHFADYQRLPDVRIFIVRAN